MNPSAKRLRIAALLLGSVVCLGSFGYMWIEGYSPLEAIYMTVITVCLLYTSPSPRDATLSRMPSSA